jgi:hypothetical protein
MDHLQKRLAEIRHRLHNPPRRETEFERDMRLQRERDEELKAIEPERVEWSEELQKAYSAFDSTLPLSERKKLLVARLRVLKSGDARDLEEFYEGVKSHLPDRGNIHDQTDYDS